MFEDIASLEDLGPVDGRNVLLRADLNVPLRASPSGTLEVADDFRIRVALPTLEWLVAEGAQVTVASHLGRPKGHPVPELSLAPVAALLDSLVPGVRVLENLRFDPGEEGNDATFGSNLAAGHHLYVNDAFGASHRAHASIVYPPTVLPSAAGRLMQRELRALGAVIDRPARPFTLVIGGAKVKDKVGVVRALAKAVDHVLVGGAMANAFFAASGREVGDARVEADEVAICREIVDSGIPVTVPTDVVAAAGDDIELFEGDVPPGWSIRDIGTLTIARFAEEIATAATVLWNGPVGVFEEPRFATGTLGVARAVAANNGLTVVGGGDTVAAIRSFGLEDAYSHLSSGGGAMLELVERGDLPGIDALRHGHPAVMRTA
jgi:phosphoglycerate kinase